MSFYVTEVLLIIFLKMISTRQYFLNKYFVPSNSMYVLFLICFHSMFIQINACCNKYSDDLRYLHKCISYIFFPCNFIIKKTPCNFITKKTRFMDSIGPLISGNRTFGKISYKHPNQIQVTKARKKKTFSWYKIPISTWLICMFRNLTCYRVKEKRKLYHCKMQWIGYH